MASGHPYIRVLSQNSLSKLHIEGATLNGEEEIMETLWSVLDDVAGITQSMSLAHRQEVLDDYMNDSIWKKIIQIGMNEFPKSGNMLLMLQVVDTILTLKLKETGLEQDTGVTETGDAYRDLTD